MRFLILLVAGAMAATDCKNAAANFDQATCHTAADDATPTACTETNCAFGTANVANQWAAAYDLVAEACRAGTALTTASNCGWCADYVRCQVDTGAARATAVAGTDGAGAGWTDETTCGAELKWYTDNVQPSCAMAWNAANAWTCADAAVDAALVAPTAPAYADPAGDYKAGGAKACTATIATTCMARAACSEFATFVPVYTAPAAAPSADDTTSGKSPAAMISAGIALIALLF